jgi:hypothetical protein
VSLRQGLPRTLGRERLLALAWAISVVLVGVAAHGRPGWVDALAASPERVREGKLWLLLSSAVLVDHPLVLSLLSFVALAGLALVVSGGRMFWRSAFLGQVLATLLVYVFFVGAVRWIVAGAFDSLVTAPDYGVSTISAAWLGSIATVGWRRRGRSRAGKCSIALSCAAVGLFAYSVRPDLNVLSTEHLVAFGLGIASAVPGWLRRRLSAVWRWPVTRARALGATMRSGRLDPIASAALALVLFVLAISEAPAALTTVRSQVAIHLHPTASRCARNWNNQPVARRLLTGHNQAKLVSIATTRRLLWRQARQRRPPKWADYCTYTFTTPNHQLVIFGLWQRGRVHRWNTPHTAPKNTRMKANATLERNGRVQLLHREDPHAPPILSS